jgi:hypothetical protein
MVMILELFSWWYTKGWGTLTRRVLARVDKILGTFSVGLLAKTLFAPFRQISAGNVQGPFNTQVRAFGDRLFSRVFGALVRGFFIVFGFSAALVVGTIGLVQLIVWPVVPFLPIVGAVLALIGWTF